MKCPLCGVIGKVKDNATDGKKIIRLRYCEPCNLKFYTVETYAVDKAVKEEFENLLRKEARERHAKNPEKRREYCRKYQREHKDELYEKKRRREFENVRKAVEEMETSGRVTIPEKMRLRGSQSVKKAL